MAQTQGTSKALAILSDNTAAPQRRSSSLPIPVDDTLNVEEQAAAASLRARDSDSDWRAFLFWQRMGKPPALDPRTSTSTRSDAAAACSSTLRVSSTGIGKLLLRRCGAVLLVGIASVGVWALASGWL